MTIRTTAPHTAIGRLHDKLRKAGAVLEAEA